jgi:4-amino-4-deoxy-L-arabinose transferase-like glycosyltransferase
LAAVFNVAAGGLLYALARRFYIEPWSARLSVLFYLIFPLNLFFGRAFMPEAAMLFFSIAALLTLDRWFESGTRLDGIWAIASAALCFLIKIPTLYMGFPLVALAWGRWGCFFFAVPLCGLI